jgi:hypothetical protein
LRHRPNDLDIDGLGQPGQLFERISGRPGLSWLLDGDQEGMLGRGMGQKGEAWNGMLLTVSAVTSIQVQSTGYA